jgi:hypothetical protein
VAAFFWRLTSVALRAPSVSRQKGKSGTSYFAQIRNFLLCLDRQKRRRFRHRLLENLNEG